MNRFVLGLGLATVVLARWAAADGEPPIIAKARDYLGTDDALANVHSLHMFGSMSTEIKGDAGSKRTARLDIVFQKPWEESLTAIAPDRIQRRVLDGYDGWLLEQRLGPGDPAVFDPHRPETLTILGVDQVRMLRADTWENLYYYRGLDEVGGTMKDLGPATVDGVKCDEVELAHTDYVVYDRFFDAATGRLVFTQTKAGAKIRENGEQMVKGIKFPKVITIDETTDGKEQLTTVTLEQVRVNEDFPESFFETPPPPLPIEEPAPSPSASANTPPASAQSPAAAANPGPSAGKTPSNP